jgi:hypothetical protein
MVNLIPVGDEGLDNNQYKPVPVEKVKQMIADYKSKRAVGSAARQAEQHLAGQTLGEIDPEEEEEQEIMSCWLCLDAVLRLFNLDEDLEGIIKHIVKKGEVSGIRVHKAISGGKETFLFTTTREEKVEGPYGRESRVQYDRLEPGSRILYVDETHTDPYGGSICPPNCTPSGTSA